MEVSAVKNEKESRDKQLEGSSLTHEQLSDVYAAGTSDGIHQLAEGKVKITDEPFDSGQK
ncbi:DUF4025 domain-containing protein [Paenibacillus sp. LMG 31458]|uniref:DUF4025 domain-containing protein n=1 Tax=Paenibacillus phytorum TaxID=2654977 RepID=A0ABX1XW67_9BACL|nr:DUF4025 domain-containing protein [Paenibacillus phytorum]